MSQRFTRMAASRRASTDPRGMAHPSIVTAVTETLEQRWLMANISGTVFNDINADGTLGASPEAGLSGWTVYRDLNNNAALDISGATTTASTDVPKTLADPQNSGDPPLTTTSTLVVPAGGSGAPLFDVNVVVNISHTYDQDLTLTLIGPNNVRVLLVDQEGSSGNNFSTTTFDDEAQFGIREGAPPFSGSFKPAVALSAFDGINPAGTWTLEMVDNAAADQGTLNSWSIQVQTSEPFTKTSASGAYAFTALGAGTYKIGTVLQGDYQYTQPVSGIRTVVLGSTDSTGQNFGVRRPPGQVQGVKWNDLNSNGVRDAGEPGLANVRIYADLNNNGAYDSSTEPSSLTDANGNYTIGNLTIGNYVIAEVVPVNSTQTFPGTFGALTDPPTKSAAVTSSVSTLSGSTSSSTAAAAPVAPQVPKTKSTTSTAGTGNAAAAAAVGRSLIFAPGTSKAAAAAALKSSPKAAALGDGTNVAAFSMADSNRWTSTALSGSGLVQGDATKLTWSVVPDGTPIAGGNGEASTPSNLRAFLNNIYGAQAVWQPLIQSALDNWSRYTGLTYIYESHDDGVGINGSGNDGIVNTRGDVRIGGHRIDGVDAQGNSGVLAYDYFPFSGGDMVIDTDDTFFANNLGNNSRGLRNTITHEDGHGIGLDHVFPVNGTKLMEPFLNLGFDGVQFDDYLAGNRGYGDPLEQGLAAAGPNNSASAAANLGTLNPGSYDARTIMDGIYISSGDPGVGALSIDDDSDVDYFKFTVASGRRVSLTLDPVGTTYLSGSSEGATAPFDAKSQSDLAIQLIGADGTTVLSSANLTGAGASEQISNYVTGAGGTFYVRITGSANAAQLYSLSLNVTAAQPGTWSVTVGAGQTVSNVNFGNHLNGAVASRLLFYNNSKFDGFDPLPNSNDDLAIATDKTALLPGAGTATFANYSSYASGINGIMIDLGGIPSNQTPTLADFTVQTGADTATEPPAWGTAPAPTFTFRRGAGANGTDRVEFTWLDTAAVKGQWIRVTTAANVRTGLAAPDVFYFGNAPGETGNSPASAIVDSADYYGVRDHLRSYDNPVPITWNWDFNRDGITDITDIMLARSQATTAATALKLITPPAIIAPVTSPGGTKTTTTTTSGSTNTPTSTVSAPRTTSRIWSVSTAAGLVRVAPTTTTTANNTPRLLNVNARGWTVATALVRTR